MGKSKKILIVDDDLRVQEILALYLQKEGFTIKTAGSGEEALSLIRAEKMDLIILDIMLPGIEGWEVCRVLRNEGLQVPVLMLTARTEDYDKIIGLDLGADDYVEKPFNPVEVMARIRAILRRSAPAEKSETVISFPGLKIDTGEFRVLLEGREITLTRREVELLAFLADHPGQVFSREQILENLWGYEYTGDNRNIDVHIKHIRDKLKSAHNPSWKLETVWGVGYRFSGERE